MTTRRSESFGSSWLFVGRVVSFSQTKYPYNHMKDVIEQHDQPSIDGSAIDRLIVIRVVICCARSSSTLGKRPSKQTAIYTPRKHRHPLKHTLKDHRMERAAAILVDGNRNGRCERKQITVFFGVLGFVLMDVPYDRESCYRCRSVITSPSEAV